MIDEAALSQVKAQFKAVGIFCDEARLRSLSGPHAHFGSSDPGLENEAAWSHYTTKRGLKLVQSFEQVGSELITTAQQHRDRREIDDVEVWFRRGQIFIYVREKSCQGNFSVGTPLDLPKLCACCMRPTDDRLQLSRSEKTFSGHRVYSFYVPMCKDCRGHQQLATGESFVGTIAKGLSFGLAYCITAAMGLLFWGSSFEMFAGCFLAAWVPYWFFRQLVLLDRLEMLAARKLGQGCVDPCPVGFDGKVLRISNKVWEREVRMRNPFLW